MEAHRRGAEFDLDPVEGGDERACLGVCVEVGLRIADPASAVVRPDLRLQHEERADLVDGDGRGAVAGGLGRPTFGGAIDGIRIRLTGVYGLRPDP